MKKRLKRIEGDIASVEERIRDTQIHTAEECDRIIARSMKQVDELKLRRDRLHEELREATAHSQALRTVKEMFS